MKENTNKAIFVNSVVLYVKMIITVISAIFTTRFALQALGVVDYGLYALLGGIVSFIVIFNTIMIRSSQRFIAVAIGKGDMRDANLQFNVNMVIHILIAAVTILLAYPIGGWYIHGFVNYDGDISNAVMVFNISVTASVISFVGVPYNALLLAKEKFIVFSGISIVFQLCKLLMAYLLTIYFEDKLFVYTCSLAILTLLPYIVYVIYCHRYYYDIVKWKFVRNYKRYKEVLSFSIWVSVGAFAMIGKNQGAALLVNIFFNTVMNTALGIANTIGAFINMFAQNVTQPMAPQITKSFAANNFERMDQLLLMSTKYAFLLMLLASSPFLIDPEWILQLWLGQVPPYAAVFLTLMIIDCLVMSLNDGISNAIFASGKIKSYQIVTSLLNIISICFGFVVLYFGSPAYYLLVVYIIFTIVRVIAVQIILHNVLNYDNRKIVYGSYIPSLMVVALFVPFLFIDTGIFHPIIRQICFICYLMSLIFMIGLNRAEKSYLFTKLRSIIRL